jgi:hypothetical protein
METKIESLPANVAMALGRFVPEPSGGPDPLAGRALAIGTDDAQHYFGLVAEDTVPADVPHSGFSVSVRDGVLGPADVAPGAALTHVRVIPGAVARCLAVALAENAKAMPDNPVSDVMWRETEETVEVMMVPPLAEDEPDPIGGATSLGVEVQYHIDKNSFALVKTTFAR